MIEKHLKRAAMRFAGRERHMVIENGRLIPRAAFEQAEVIQ